jgi:hypothetical protein
VIKSTGAAELARLCLVPALRRIVLESLFVDASDAVVLVRPESGIGRVKCKIIEGKGKVRKSRIKT